MIDWSADICQADSYSKVPVINFKAMTSVQAILFDHGNFVKSEIKAVSFWQADLPH